MGNIWYRADESGEKKIKIYNLINFMIAPLYKNLFWEYEFLNINWLFVSIVSGIFAIIIKLIYQYIIDIYNTSE